MKVLIWKEGSKGASSSLTLTLSASFYLTQGFCQTPAAVNCDEGSPEELCCIPETSQLAVVETLYQGNDRWKAQWLSFRALQSPVESTGLEEGTVCHFS